MMQDKNFRPILMGCIGMAWLLSGPCGWAQDLGAITVSAGRGTQLEDMDVGTTLLTREDIARAPETTVDQLLNKIPGIFIPNQPSTQLHPTGQVLSLRGFGTSTNGLTLVLLDGVPMNDPYFRTVNWAQIPKASIERIEIIRGGGATSLWGNMAMGGVINIVTRQPQPGEKTLQTSYGSFNTRTLDAGIGTALNDEITLGLNYGGSSSAGYNQTPDAYRHPAMDATAAQANNLTARLDYRPNAVSRYFVKLQASDTHEDGLIWSLANNQWETYRMTFGGQTRLSDKSSFNVNGWFMQGSMATQNVSNSSYSLATPTAGTPYVSQQEKAQYHSTGASAYWQTEWGRVKDAKFGFDLRTVSINDPVNVLNAAGALTGSVASQATHQFAGLFAQGTYRPEAMPLDVTLGLREDFWQTDNASSSGVSGGASFNNALPNQSTNRFDPRLGAKYYLDGGWDVRAATYRGFSAPGMNQMYRSFISGSNYTLPDTSLLPQTNQGYELGFDLKRPDYDLAFTAYNNQVHNYIDYARGIQACNSGNNYCGSGNSSVTGGNQYVNAGDATLRGYELLGTWRTSSTLALNGGFSHTAAYLTSSYNTTTYPLGQQLGQVPLWMASLGATWQASAKVTLTGQLKDFPDYWNSTNHLQVNQGAVLLDLGVNYKYDRQIDVFGLAQNLSNKSYYDQGLAYNANGTLNTGTLPALGLPRSITVGVRAAF